MHARALLLGAALPLVLVAAHANADANADAGANEPAKPEAKEAPDPAARNEARARAAAVTITVDGKTQRCREQTAQPFLVRGSWFPSAKDPAAVKAGRKMLEDAIRYRTETYGYFEGFGNARWNRHPPKHYAKTVQFQGMSAQVHEKIIPALKCVEAALKASGADAEYKPRAMGGIRFKNTYRGVEVSNHVYGIAIDIEPDKNTCCGCVKPWNEHPLCKKKVASVFERMAMPKSWVDAFERYGFYWLGHDVLADTMHFEFLGDPDKVLE